MADRSESDGEHRPPYRPPAADGVALIHTERMRQVMQEGWTPEQAALDDLLAEHRPMFSHQCICGWQGDSFATHVVDSIGLRYVGDLEALESSFDIGLVGMVFDGRPSKSPFPKPRVPLFTISTPPPAARTSEGGSDG